MRTPQAVAALLLLGAGFLAFAAPDEAQASQAAADAETAGYYERPHLQHLCLKEAKKYNCRGVGCPNITRCDGEPCSDCFTNFVYQSDLTCCEETKEYYKETHEDLFTPGSSDPLRIGTCDWDYDLYKCEDGTQSTTDSECYEPIPMENGAFKIGTAWATCYLNEESARCHGPFCDDMVLSFHGGLYSMTAYAAGVPLTPTVDTVCEPFWTFPYDPTRPGVKGRVKKGEKSTAKQSPLHKAIHRTDLPKKLQAKKAEARTESGSYSKYHSHNTTADWQVGIASVFSGTVTITSLQKKLEFSRGMLEYTMDWSEASALPSNTVPGKTAVVVAPYTYDIVLTKDGADYYKESKYGLYPKEGGEREAQQ